MWGWRSVRLCEAVAPRSGELWIRAFAEGSGATKDFLLANPPPNMPDVFGHLVTLVEQRAQGARQALIEYLRDVRLRGEMAAPEFAILLRDAGVEPAFETPESGDDALLAWLAVDEAYARRKLLVDDAHIAVVVGDMDMLRSLIAAGEPFDRAAGRPTRMRPIQWALERNREDMAMVFLEAGAREVRHPACLCCQSCCLTC
jgi:hypothetical protein